MMSGRGAGSAQLLAAAAVIGLGLLNWSLLTAEIDISAIAPPDMETQNLAATTRGRADDAGTAGPAAYPQTLARPLFRASRRPPEAEKPQVAARPQPVPRQAARLPENLALVGVMREHGRAGRALIRLGESAGQWVEVGHMLQGWRLSRIDAAGIAFEADGQEQRLSLFHPGNGDKEASN
jgi:general secretion pathway protein N